jgi:DNA invertase Pin-like site-specific DNA recombinase
MLHRQMLNTTTPSDKAMFQMMGVSAEFERALIRERVNAGLERACAQGKALGRPRTDATETASRDALQKWDPGIRKIAGRFGVGTWTVQWIKAELAAASTAEIYYRVATGNDWSGRASKEELARNTSELDHAALAADYGRRARLASV